MGSISFFMDVVHLSIAASHDDCAEESAPPPHHTSSHSLDSEASSSVAARRLGRLSGRNVTVSRPAPVRSRERTLADKSGHKGTGAVTNGQTASDSQAECRGFETRRPLRNHQAIAMALPTFQLLPAGGGQKLSTGSR